ncbi:hypothetical protein PQ455_14280 [Sphingomonas naphthae]|uniref:Uncharacterized protein n=1 Tax=Sphingomonas naphthae TaxID=1813468 RepID=A0ABY7TKI7_9SPHN|nr:hypothetical protein [Sphingomonas naphthae]WCT72794.1 hypothetical protein PQ455_14280 [Sphingomonas naphthae]
MSVTSDFYLARAAECEREAQATTLENVRDRCRRSEAAWREMAARMVKGETMRVTLAAEKQAKEGIAQ